MGNRLRILVISAEVWNDKIHGNGVLSNWFTEFDADFANIYCSPGLPLNYCCKKYFQITDKSVIKRLLFEKELGYRIEYYDFPSEDIENAQIGERLNKRLYSLLKKTPGEIRRTVRELLWSFVSFDNVDLNEFVSDFKPDLIFCARKATPTILRLEKHVVRISGKPIAAFIADDDYSFRQFSLSPLFWVNRLILRKMLRNAVSNYGIFYSMTETQKTEYSKYFQRDLKVLTKCGKFESSFQKKVPSSVIKMVYAGKLYCGRDKILINIGKALKEINNEGTKMVLNIYTNDYVGSGQRKILNDGVSTFLNRAVPSSELSSILLQSDIALHVESFDLKNRLLTRLSFSAKIIDCLASGCAVMAISWKEHAGYQYLQKENAAILVGNKKDILPTLNEIVNRPSLISEYSEKAWTCGVRNHHRKDIQSMLYNDFKRLASEN